MRTKTGKLRFIEGYVPKPNEAFAVRQQSGQVFVRAWGEEREGEVRAIRLSDGGICHLPAKDYEFIALVPDTDDLAISFRQRNI